MRGKRLLVALVAAGATFGIATAVQASIPDSNQIVHSCYNTSLAHGSPIGAMRAIDTDKVGGACASWEGAVDLATPQYVQNVVTSTINQTSFTESFSFNYFQPGEWTTFWDCPSGYVGTSPWVQSNQFFGDNERLTVRSTTDGGEAGNGVVAGQPPNNHAEIYYVISSGTPTYVNGVTCVDARVYGEPGPTAPLTKATAQATAIVKPAS
jgi:hypothetical protein